MNNEIKSQIEDEIHKVLRPYIGQIVHPNIISPIISELTERLKKFL